MAQPVEPGLAAPGVPPSPVVAADGVGAAPPGSTPFDEAELSETVHKLILEAGEASGRTFQRTVVNLCVSVFLTGAFTGSFVTLLVTS